MMIRAFRLSILGGLFLLTFPIATLSMKSEPISVEEARDTLLAAELEVNRSTQSLQDFRATPVPVIEAQQQLYWVTLSAKEDALERAKFNYDQAQQDYQKLLVQQPEKKR